MANWRFRGIWYELLGGHCSWVGKHDKVYYYNWKERFAELGSQFQYCWATARCCTIIWNHKWYKGFALVMEANRKAHELYIPWKNTKPSKKQKGTSSTQKYQTGRDMLNVCIMSLSRDWFPRRYHWFIYVPWFGMTYHRTLPPTFSLDKYCNQQKQNSTPSQQNPDRQKEEFWYPTDSHNLVFAD